MKLKHPDQTAARNGGTPAPGRWTAAAPVDRSRWLQTSEYTPMNVSRILEAANEGDIAELAVAAREIMERNWEVILAMQVRKSALTGLEWGVDPGDGRPASKEAAEAFEVALRTSGGEPGLASFHELADHLMDAVVAPLAAAEIVWGAGGSLAGFRPVGAWHFTFRGSETPLLVTDDNRTGIPLPPAKFIVHTRGGAGDPARAGLIRTLIWLHVFQNYPVKDLVSFVERYGMPFVVAKVDRSAWENERGVMRNLIRSFGPNGGGVFTKSTELELLQASNAGGDVYFKLLEYTSKAITKVILGQLASSSDSGGLSGGDAQSRVRGDLLEADARAIESTVRAQIAVPWTRFNFGDTAAVPALRFRNSAQEDRAVFAGIVETLHRAGLDADPAEISARFGLSLTRAGTIAEVKP
jgi:phage gp29-like protein